MRRGRDGERRGRYSGRINQHQLAVFERGDGDRFLLGDGDTVACLCLDIFDLHLAGCGHEVDTLNVLWVNEEVGLRLALKNDDKLFLENQDGIRSMKPVSVYLTPGIRPDCVYLVHGFGVRSHLLGQGFDQGVSDSLLMTRNRPDPLSGSRGMRVNFVRLIRNGMPLNLA